MPDKHEVGGSSPLGPTNSLGFEHTQERLECVQSLMKIKLEVERRNVH